VEFANSGSQAVHVNQRFTLDRKSFEQFIAAISVFQSLQQAATRRNNEQSAPLLEYLIETLRAIDSRTLPLSAALERVAGLALPIVGGDRAVVWLFTSYNLICRAAAGASFEDSHLHTPLRSKLQSAGAFGDNPPARLDLTRTLETNSKSVGSSLGIALLPGGRIAGALAVFSDPSRTFTERNYANLRLLAGLAQYILTKWLAERGQPDSPGTSPAERPDRSPFREIRVASSMARSASAPLIFPESYPEPLRHEPVPDFYVPGVSTRAALGGLMNGPTQIATDRPSFSPPAALQNGSAKSFSDNPPESVDRKSPGWPFQRGPALQRWVKWVNDSSPGGMAHVLTQTLQRWEKWRERFKRRTDYLTRTYQTWQPARLLNAKAWDLAESISRRIRNVRQNRAALRYAAPITVLAVMSFFVGHLAGGRQRLAIGSLNPVAQAATQPVTTHNPGIDGNQKAPTVVPNKSTATPSATSHLQVTDPETAATIAELSKYEVRTLRRAAQYGDDEAALQLGMLQELGRGVPQSCRQAAAWVTKAAQEGNASAQYNLGLRYRDGDGVDSNLQQAENWLRKAAARKNLRAASALAELPSQLAETSVSQITNSSQPTIATP
jgi:hypothetical protein